MPKPVADRTRRRLSLDVFVTVVVLAAAMVSLIVALGTGHTGLAWGSVALSAMAVALILTRWRRSWVQREDVPDDELVSLRENGSVDAEPGSASTEDAQPGEAQSGKEEPGEEDTDAADLLVVYELIDDVLVVDEHPRYHLPCCRWLDHAPTESLPVREARELGFTPCERCRPDTTLARKHRSARARS